MLTVAATSRGRARRAGSGCGATEVSLRLPRWRGPHDRASRRSGGDYLLGYGSLINPKSRKMTAQLATAHPVTVSGFRRTWWVPPSQGAFRSRAAVVCRSYGQTERGMTAVAAVPRAGSTLNGVLVRVKSSDLPKFDAREKRYQRARVPINQVRVLNNGAPRADAHRALADAEVLTYRCVAGVVLHPEDRVWIYVAEEQTRPVPELPIAQSYVDLFVAGCLKYGRAFAM